MNVWRKRAVWIMISKFPKRRDVQPSVSATIFQNVAGRFVRKLKVS